MYKSDQIISRIANIGLLLTLWTLSTDLLAMSADIYPLITNAVKGQGLTLIDATAPSFKDELRQLVTPEDMVKISLILPYSVIVANDTGRYIYGFTVIYKYPDRLTPDGVPWQHRISRTAPTPNDLKYMLSPGDRYLMTPVSDLNAVRDASGKQTHSLHLDDDMDRIIQVFAKDLAKERCELSVDSIIFDDGTLVGPDTAGRMAKINSRIKGEADLVIAIKDLHGNELRKQLLHYLDVRSDDAEYAMAQNRAAGFLLTVPKNSGEAAVTEAAGQWLGTRSFRNTAQVKRSDK